MADKERRTKGVQAWCKHGATLGELRFTPKACGKAYSMRTVDCSRMFRWQLKHFRRQRQRHSKTAGEEDTLLEHYNK